MAGKLHAGLKSSLFLCWKRKDKSGREEGGKVGEGGEARAARALGTKIRNLDFSLLELTYTNLIN